MTKVVEVAVAILVNAQGEYLLASRPDGKGWAGWWEFPGGKVEQGETPQQALVRELQEELEVRATTCQPWMKRRYDYPATQDDVAKTVLLHFFFVQAWEGQLKPMEGQQLAWQHPQAQTVKPILPANAPIMHALSLPPMYAVSNAAEMGETQFLDALQQQLQHGLKLIQVREKQMQQEELIALIKAVQALAKPYDARVLLNQDIALALALALDGVHLPSQALMQLHMKPQDLPTGFLLAASCHDGSQLAKAQALGLDFVTLSPVASTQSHPDTDPLGWATFANLIENIEVPVYALGGMQMADVSEALSCGARGIAMQRAVWAATQL